MLGVCPFVDQLTITSFDTGYLARVGFCDHISEGHKPGLSNPNYWNTYKLSAHFVVMKDGSALQLVNIFDTAWAEGILGPVQTWNPFQTMVQETGSNDPNNWLISFEHEGDYQELWTPEMYQTDLKIKQWCIQECQKVNLNIMRFGLDSLSGHYMFDNVNRANCPGPNWPREALWNALGGDEVFTRFNGLSNPYWQNHSITNQEVMNARLEFNLPAEATSIDLDVYLANGVLEVHDGAGPIAGIVGWGGQEHAVVRVILDSSGTIYFNPQNPAIIDTLGILGFYS